MVVLGRYFLNKIKDAVPGKCESGGLFGEIKGGSEGGTERLHSGQLRVMPRKFRGRNSGGPRLA